MSELPNREIKRDEFMHDLNNNIGPQFENEDLDFLFKDNAKRKEICKEIDDERMFQIAKWGKIRVPIYMGLSVLSEEVGEANKAVLENNPKEYRSELIQVAAVCMRLIEELDSFNLSADSFGCTRQMLPEADEWFTEKEKAAIVLDEMAKSDDGKVRESAFRLKNSVDAIEAFGSLDQVESKPTGYLNGKIQTIEKRLEKLFNRVKHAEARLNICERYESKVESAEKRLEEHLAEIKSLALLVHNIVPRVETLEKAEVDRVEQQARRDWVAANLPNPPEAPDTVASTDEDESPTFDNLEEAREFIECFEADCPRPWTVDRRDLICDAMGISLHAGVHFNDYIDALRTLAGLK